MNTKVRLLGLVVSLGLFLKCSNDDGTTIPLNNEVNEFVWQAMNFYYYWVDDVEDLSVEKYPTLDDLYVFLNEYPDPSELYYTKLLIPEDQFSWIVDDYEELEASFQGTTKTFGYEIRVYRESSTRNIYGFVKYVIPNGPAEIEGLKRGDIFTKVDGIVLTEDNINQLLLNREQYTLSLGEVIDGVVRETDEVISLTAIELTENPIFLDTTYQVENGTVGYLVYNQFVDSKEAHQELNEVFGRFKSNGVSDLVLDLRYNPGGAVATSEILASLIYGEGTEKEVFTTSDFNPKIEEVFSELGTDPNIYFRNTISDKDDVKLNRLLGVDRLIILITGSTASASELIIAGLSPYMNVTLIGTKSVGKNLGSLTLYDSDNFAKSPSGSTVNHTNPDHKYAIQPIISRFTNINNIDYGFGF